MRATTLIRALVASASLLGCGETAQVAADAGPPTWESVQAIIARSCAFSSCHGAARAHPRLAADLAYEALTTGRSMQDPSLRLVMPGDPSQSWIMHKLDGTMSSRPICSDATRPCGTSMPQSSELLPAAERELIRTWIRLGAQGPRDR